MNDIVIHASPSLLCPSVELILWKQNNYSYKLCRHSGGAETLYHLVYFNKQESDEGRDFSVEPCFRIFIHTVSISRDWGAAC